MRFVVVAIGRLKDGPERVLTARYLDRAQALARPLGFAGVDLREADESRARAAETRKSDEAAILERLLPSGAFRVALDEGGASLSSAQFAAELARLRDDGCPAYGLMIGGPDGLAPSLRQSARRVLAFGAQTWPHQLVRVLAAEQIYRALTILARHPYHRE